MKVSIFGSGYVGLVTAACFAEAGNTVVCVDVDESKVASLRQGICPFFEPGLETLLKQGQTAGRLRFTTDAAEAVRHGLFQFIAVGTPPGEDGSADLQYVLQVAETIGAHMDGYRVVVTKSTVPVGTADKVAATLSARLSTRGTDVAFDVVSNPEFLKEGAAVNDFRKPDRVVVGADAPRAAELMRALYAPFNRNHDRILLMDVRSAELTKYAANAMLATKISFMNELANIADRVGADIERVRIGIGSDPRIGYHFIYPGAGYGGSCFPKDVKALAHTAREAGHAAELLDAVESVNKRQKQVLIDKLRKHFGSLRGKTIAVWGLAFKPNTDDMREAPSRVLMEAVWAEGGRIRAFDPVAGTVTRSLYPDKEGLVLTDSPEAAVEGADAWVLMTEWRLFQSPDFDDLGARMKTRVLFDGRNIYDPEIARSAGFTYYGIGRAAN